MELEGSRIGLECSLAPVSKSSSDVAMMKVLSSLPEGREGMQETNGFKLKQAEIQRIRISDFIPVFKACIHCPLPHLGKHPVVKSFNNQCNFIWRALWDNSSNKIQTKWLDKFEPKWWQVFLSCSWCCIQFPGYIGFDHNLDWVNFYFLHALTLKFYWSMIKDMRVE